MIKHLERESDFENITKEKCLVDFYADWCGPCKMMGSLLEELEPNLEIPIVKINTDACPNISVSMGVMSIPTLLLMEDGKELKRHIGFMPEDELKEFIK